MDSVSSKGKKRKKAGLTKDEELELERLEDLILGRGKHVLKHADNPPASENEDVIDNSKKIKLPEAAWDDPDDSNVNVEEALAAQGRPKMGVPAKGSDHYQTMLKKRFEIRVGNSEWARLDRKVEHEDIDLLQRCGNFIEQESATLSKGILDIKKVKNLNKATGREGPYINSVQFHRTSTVALVAGTSGKASIFQVDGSSNPLLQTVKFDKFPIRCARFSADGNQFIVGSQHHSHYFVYDMMEGKSIRIPTHHATEQTTMKKFEVSPDGKLLAVCGRFGDIHLINAHTKEWIGTLKMNGEVKALCFNASGSQLWTHGATGEVYVWDTGSRKYLHRFVDDGCLEGSSISVSPSGQLVACGSTAGVVNVYNTQSALRSTVPQPAKAFMHLVTAASSLQFDPSSQLLAMASDGKDGAFKLVHFPSMTVFSNFPAKDRELLLGRVQSHDFSPNSGFLAVGNSQHTVQLFRLKHFGNY
ncbi:U3 snoRNP protein [Homalodisca vitripennis]|nr:U3 snoRNP protein [Homalodisca vitripennis]